MEWVIVVALLLGVPLSVWMYTRAFRRVYIGQEAMVMVTQYTSLDATIAFVVALYLMSSMLVALSGGKTRDPISVDAQLILVGYLLFYGTLLLVIFASLVLRRIKLGDVFRFVKCRCYVPPDVDLCFCCSRRRSYLWAISFSIGWLLNRIRRASSPLSSNRRFLNAFRFVWPL